MQKTLQNSYFSERFGKNYIEVGQYFKYTFAAGILRTLLRFVCPSAFRGRKDVENSDR